MSGEKKLKKHLAKILERIYQQISKIKENGFDPVNLIVVVPAWFGSCLDEIYIPLKNTLRQRIEETPGVRRVIVERVSRIFVRY